MAPARSVRGLLGNGVHCVEFFGACRNRTQYLPVATPDTTTAFATPQQVNALAERVFTAQFSAAERKLVHQ